MLIPLLELAVLLLPADFDLVYVGLIFRGFELELLFALSGLDLNVEEPALQLVGLESKRVSLCLGFLSLLFEER